MPHFFSSLTYITYVGDRKKSCRKCTTTHSTLLCDYNIFCKYKKLEFLENSFPCRVISFFSLTQLCLEFPLKINVYIAHWNMGVIVIIISTMTCVLLGITLFCVELWIKMACIFFCHIPYHFNCNNWRKWRSLY